MTTETEKAVSLLKFDERRADWARSSNLSDGELDLVFDTQLQAWRTYLKGQGIEVAERAMTPSQKNAKRSLKEKLASGLNDLQMSAFLLFGPMEQGIRFKQKDLLAVFDSGKVADIVRECGMHLGLDEDGNDLGRAFAYRILDALRDVFPDDDILIVRGLKAQFGLDERRRAFSDAETRKSQGRRPRKVRSAAT